MLSAKLLNVITNIVEINELLLQNILQKYNNHSNCACPIYFVLRISIISIVVGTLAHTTLQKELDKLFRKLYDLT